MNEFVILYSRFKDLDTWHFTPFSTEVREAEVRLHQLSYPLVKLNEIGVTFRGYARVDRSLEHGIPLITARNVAMAEFTFEDHQAFISEVDHEKWFKSAVSYGDVLLNLYVATAQNLAAVYESTLPANLPSNIARIITNPLKILPHYLAQYFNSQTGRVILQQYAVGTVRSSLTLSALIHSVSIPLPPIAEQIKIVARQEEIYRLADQKQQEVNNLREQADDLFSTQ